MRRMKHSYRYKYRHICTHVKFNFDKRALEIEKFIVIRYSSINVQEVKRKNILFVET